MQIFAIVVSFALTVAAVALLVPAVRRMLGVIRSGQPAPGRTGNPTGRAVTMLKETFLHTRMLQWHWIGVMHWFVYAAFLFLSTAVLAAYFQLFTPSFAWPLVGHWYPYEWFSELIGLLSTVGIVYLIVYRQKHHPRSEGRRSRFFGSNFWQAYFVEALALLEGGAILFVRAAEWKLDEDAGRSHYPIASWIGDALYTNDASTLENLIYAIAAFKIALAMIWLMVIARNITMGIAWHRFTAWFNIYFKREDDGSTALGAMKPLTSAGKPITLDDIDDLDEDSALGVGTIEDFSWKGILDFTTCTECGRCQSQCPAWNTEKPLSPKLLITALRDHAYAKADGDEAHTERALVGVGSKGESARHRRRGRPGLLLQPGRRRLRHRRGRALELYVVRRLRPAVPRRHRARRPHHGHAAPPAAGGVELPGRAQPALQGPGEQGQPVEHVELGSHGLGQGPRVRRTRRG